MIKKLILFTYLFTCCHCYSMENGKDTKEPITKDMLLKMQIPVASSFYYKFPAKTQKKEKKSRLKISKKQFKNKKRK